MTRRDGTEGCLATDKGGGRAEAVLVGAEGQIVTWTKRPHWRDVPGQSSALLYTMRRGHYQLVIRRAWWRSGSGCLARDLVETSPLVSGDPCNPHRRLRPGSCPDSRPLSDLLGGRRCLPARWLHPLPR